MNIEKIVKGHTAKSEDELFSYICSCEEHEVSTRYILGVLEDISIGIRVGYSDENILYESLSNIVKLFFSLHMYVDRYRRELKDDFYMIEAEKLAHSWRNNRRLSDGALLPELKNYYNTPINKQS